VSHFLTQLGLPTSAVAGLPGGAAYALIGVGLVLLYQMGGVLSFTQASLGVFGAVLFQHLTQAGSPLSLALPAGLLLSAAIGGVIGWAMAKWFADKSVLIRSAVTIAITVSFSALALRLYGSQSLYFPYLIPTARIKIASVAISANTLMALGLVVFLGLGLRALLRWTRLGVWLRAMSERAQTAELLRVPVRSLSIGLWAFSGVLAAFAIILIAPSQQSDVGTLGSVVIQPFAAALAAGFRSFGVTIATALAIGAFEGTVTATSLGSYSSVVSLVLILAVLLWTRRRDVWNEAR
jgi:branched-chain amino acid transport system permease protein